MVAKRGRKPQGPYSGKSTALTTRITPELKKKLERARKEHPRPLSLSQEVEARLRLSFDEDGQVTKLFGSAETYAIARLVAEIIDQVEGLSHRHWANDAFTVRACAQAIGRVLVAFQGSDDDAAPAHLAKHFTSPEETGEALAGGILDQLRMTAEQPIDSPGRYYSKQAKLYPRIKTALGNLMERLT